MKLKTMFGIGLVSFGVAFAQDAYESGSAPAGNTMTAQSLSEQELQKQEEKAAASEDLTAPVPFVKPDIPKESRRTPFNAILHGKSYNKNSNMAAANNTDLLLTYPNLFANRKFFYIEPTSKLGILSLGSFFTAFDISRATHPANDDLHREVGRLTLGYAAPGFGFYFRAGLGSIWGNSYTERDTVVNGERVTAYDETKIDTTYGGDDWAFAISKGFLGMNVALYGDWVTHKQKIHKEPDRGQETKDRFDSLTLNLNLTNAPTAKNFTWTLGARFINFNNETKYDGKVRGPGDPPSYWSLDPYIRGGLSVLENENARILFGTAAIFSYRHFDEPLDDAFALAAIVQPSMMGEVFVGESKNFMFYGEAGYNWFAFRYSKHKDGNDNELYEMGYEMESVNASVGFRYQYKDFLAVELGLEEKLFRNPGSIFQDTQTLANFSAMVRF